MGERVMSKRLSRIILVVIIALQCATMFYWALRKANYYNDEYYTFEYAQNINNDWNPFEYMTFSKDWKEEEWLSVKDLKTRFTVDEGESVFDHPFRQSFRRFFTQRNYMWILNALESVIGDRLSPTWICICLNIFIWILFQFLLFYFLADCLRLDRRSSLLAVAMWGFCPFVLGLAVFCRFYVWALFLFLIVVVLHRLMWDCDSVVKNLLYEITAALAMYLAYKNSELIVFACGCLMLFFTIGLFARKRYAEALYYSLPLIGGGFVMMLKTTRFINAVLHPRAFAQGGSQQIISAYSRHSAKMLDTPWSEKMTLMWQMIKEFGDSVSGSVYLFVIGVIFLIVLCFLMRKKLSWRPDGFIVILSGVALAFWLFCGFYVFSHSRYHSVLFLLVMIVAWWAFDRLSRSHPLRKVFYKVALCLVVVGAVMPFFRRNVEYVYEGWKPFVETLSEYKDTKNLLVTNDRFLVPYACVNLMDESNSLYAIFDSASFYGFGKLPDLPSTFLLWVEHDSYPPILQMGLNSRGYHVEPIVRATYYDIYVCKR